MTITPKNTLRRLTDLLIHLIVIAILCVFPEMLTAVSFFGAVPSVVYLRAIIYLGVFYLNYYIIAPRCLNRSHGFLAFVSINFGVLIVTLVMCQLASWAVFKVKPFSPGLELEHLTMILRDMIMIILVIALCTAIRMSQRWIEQDNKTQEAISSQRTDELRSLRSQLHPHFLFNTLNSIYALIDISPKKAQSSLHELSNLLRYTLYDNRGETVTLRRELDFVRHLVELQSLRMSDPSRISLTLEDDGCGDWRITPLLFITLIENVFKHGLAAPGPIIISIIASRATNTVVCHTSNPVALPPVSTIKSEKADGGIGLNNLRRRLQLIYGKTATLSVASDSHSFKATLEVPLAPYYSEKAEPAPEHITTILSISNTLSK